jgi:acyl-CoA reductase-like NAD-dependent aldehyde dehydrogenase
MASRIGDLRVGDVLADGSRLDRVDVGAMVTDRLFDELEGLIADAVKMGARCLVGGKRFVNEEFPSGHYFSPTLLVDVWVSPYSEQAGNEAERLCSRRTPDMAIANQEIFAPVMTVLKFDTKDEAIAIANGTRYGLGASVFGRSKVDCRYVVERLEAGMVCTNGSSPPFAFEPLFSLILLSRQTSEVCLPTSSSPTTN